MRYNGCTVPSLPLLCTVRKDLLAQSIKPPNQEIQHVRCCRVMTTLRHDVTVTLATPHSLTVQEDGVPSWSRAEENRKQGERDVSVFLSACFNFAVRGVQTSLTAAD